MYNFKFHPEAQKELKKLNKSIQILFTKKLKHIINNPEIGKQLDNKNNLKLAGLRKAYFNNKKYRIVYEIVEQEILIYIIAIDKRYEMDVYKKADGRVN